MVDPRIYQTTSIRSKIIFVSSSYIGPYFFKPFQNYRFFNGERIQMLWTS